MAKVSQISSRFPAYCLPLRVKSAVLMLAKKQTSGGRGYGGVGVGTFIGGVVECNISSHPRKPPKPFYEIHVLRG